MMVHREAFHVLASADRQLVLHRLVRQSGAVSIESLSREVASRRLQVSPTKIDDVDVERARIRLVHTHLPRLADANVIDDDWDEGTISLAEDAAVDDVLDAAAELDRWPPNDVLERPSEQ